jgi:hypothetical protein
MVNTVHHGYEGKAIIKDDLHEKNGMMVIAMLDDFMRREAIIKKALAIIVID